MKRTISVILCLLTLLSIITGCASNQTVDTTSAQTSIDETAVEEETTTKLTHALPTVDWEGRQFRVMGRIHERLQFQNFEIAAAEMNGDIVNDAVYSRNAGIKEKYNVEVVDASSQDPKGQIQKYVNAGDDAVDLIFNTMTEAGVLASGGYYVDLNTIPNIDFTMPWWNADVNESVSLAGRLYFTTNSFDLMDKNRAYILMFNKNMVQDYNLGDIYATVRDGKFTMDAIIQLCKTVSADIDGDGAMTDLDRYGLSMDSRNSFFVTLTSQGNKVIKKDSDDLPVFAINNEHMLSSIDKSIALCCDTNISVTCEAFQGKVDYDYWNVSSKAFKGGRSLFCTSFINMPFGLKTMSADCDFDYGVIPYPKFDEEQENYISVPDPSWATMIAVPTTITDIDFNGFMLELLAYSTLEEVMPAYYEISAKAKYTYDPESAEMLDLIFSTLTYDLGIIFNWGNIKGLLTSDMPKSGVNDLASKYAKLEEKALKEMDKTLEAFESFQ